MSERGEARRKRGERFNDRTIKEKHTGVNDPCVFPCLEGFARAARTTPATSRTMQHVIRHIL